MVLLRGVKNWCATHFIGSEIHTSIGVMSLQIITHKPFSEPLDTCIHSKFLLSNGKSALATSVYDDIAFLMLTKENLSAKCHVFPWNIPECISLHHSNDTHLLQGKNQSNESGWHQFCVIFPRFDVKVKLCMKQFPSC